MTMSAIDYLEAKYKICKSQETCEGCALCTTINGFRTTCTVLENTKPEKIVKLAEKWVAEHSLRTYKSEMIATFPQCYIDVIIQENCPHEFFGEVGKLESCPGVYRKTKCTECWSREVSE